MMGLTQMEVENTLSKIIVRNKRLGPEDIPMILAEKEQEVYSMVADWWQSGPLHNFPQQAFKDNLTQRYAYHAVKEKLIKEGSA